MSRGLAEKTAVERHNKIERLAIAIDEAVSVGLYGEMFRGLFQGWIDSGEGKQRK